MCLPEWFPTTIKSLWTNLNHAAQLKLRAPSTNKNTNVEEGGNQPKPWAKNMSS